MRIQFVLNTLVLTGGVRVVFEHSRRLIARGHTVRLLAPRMRPPSARRGALAWKRYLYERWSGAVEDGLRSYGLADTLTRFDPHVAGSVPDADVVIATAWETANWVMRFPERAGQKYYFILGYEVWTEGIREEVEATWRLPMRKVTIAHWLERLAQDRFGEQVWARIPNGVDTTRFQPGPRCSGPPFTVAMLYDRAAHKGVEDGVAALWAIHAAEPKTRFTVFGRNRLHHRLPPGSRYLRNRQERDLPSVYQSADVFVNSSLSEGFSLVTLEAMACGCALVATAVGEATEMGKPGEEYLLAPAGQPEVLAGEAIGLLRDAPRLRAVSAAGLSLARRYTWEHATDELEHALARGE